MKRFVLVAAIAALFCSTAPQAMAAGWPTPGSLLVYPIYDSTAGIATVLTVTNTNADQVSGAVYVEFMYIDGETCQEFNRTERLSPNDTFTAIAGAHNAESAIGYVYVFAKNAHNGDPIDFDYLIGNLISVNGIETFEYGMNAVTFEGETGYRVETDVDGDGILDMDGNEYSMAPDEILVPRFFGQGGVFESELILVNLSGGTQFLTTIDFLVYNDHEQQFSTEYSFVCWAKVPLLDISGVFSEYFLDWSIDDLGEILGMESVESGWFRMDGGIANSTAASIDDPAFLAALVESVAAFSASDIPFATGTQDNGDLLPRSVHGDS